MTSPDSDDSMPSSHLARAKRSRKQTDEQVLTKKYGAVIGKRYDGNGKLIPPKVLAATSGSSMSSKTKKRKIDDSNDAVNEKQEKVEKEPVQDELIAEAKSESQSDDEGDDEKVPRIEVDDDYDDYDDSEDDEDWEDVVLDERASMIMESLEDKKQETTPIQISLDDEASLNSKSSGKGKKRIQLLSKEERSERILIHKLHLMLLLSHVAVRNRFCNDPELRGFYRKAIPKKILTELHPELDTELQNKNTSNMLLTRKLLDGLRHLMDLWKTRFKVKGSSGLTMTSWKDIYRKDRKIESKIDRQKFVKLLMKFKGSRDLGAQGFCSILRAAGINARLVCSLQPLDFTSNSPVGEKNADDEKDLEEIPPPSDFPVYWVEVWDQYMKRWIAIDPIVQGTVEPASLHRKSKLEPPLSDRSNIMRYVIAFEPDGSARDVTRRYAYFFNAKTRKKRITNIPGQDVWYSQLLGHFARKTMTDQDKLEDQEMVLRNQAEEIPTSIQDFKGHPMYVLERHLRQNEVLDKKEACGFIAIKKAGIRKQKNKAAGVAVPVAPLEKIYKRSDVKLVRSARGWYQLGRIIKPGMQPRKHVIRKQVKRGKRLDDDDMFADDNEEEEEEATGLYSEDQTEMYIPPAIVDGKIPRNAYGNIDVYVPSMLPEGSVLLQYPHIEIAAKLIDVDYANAVVGFDFGKGKGRKGATATARINGIVVAKEYSEAVHAVYDQILEEQREADRERAISMALRRWKKYLTALRIEKRLNKDHGAVEDMEKLEEQKNASEVCDIQEAASDVNNNGDEGGFLPESTNNNQDEGGFLTSPGGGFVSNSQDDQEGGFTINVENSNEGDIPYENTNEESPGGFVITNEHDDDDEGGGFLTNEAQPSIEINESSDEGGGFISDSKSNVNQDVEMQTDEEGGFLPEDSATVIPKLDSDLKTDPNVIVISSDEEEGNEVTEDINTDDQLQKLNYHEIIPVENVQVDEVLQVIADHETDATEDFESQSKVIEEKLDSNRSNSEYHSSSITQSKSNEELVTELDARPQTSDSSSLEDDQDDLYPESMSESELDEDE